MADPGFQKGGFEVGSRPAALAASLEGSVGMPPQKNLGNIDALRCNLAHSGVETELLLDSPLVASLR